MIVTRIRASTSKSPNGRPVFVARSVASSRMSEACARSKERQAPRPRGSGRASLTRRSRTAAGSSDAVCEPKGAGRPTDA